MAKNQYEGYQYIDLDNLYTYENSTVLINKQHILDPNSAKNNEHLHVSKRLTDLYIQPILVYSTDDIQKIHKYLFKTFILGQANTEELISLKAEILLCRFNHLTLPRNT